MLTLIYITNNPIVALIAEKNGVERVMVDLETLGKEERQRDMDTVKSRHAVGDVRIVSEILTDSEMMVRINPWNEMSVGEIETVISAGANRIMLPMWKTEEEVNLFLGTVNGRVHTTLLLETKEAVEIVDKVLKHPLLDEVHIGLNDLCLSYGLTFMFELLSNGVVERLCQKFKIRGIKYGFGGIAKIGEGVLPAECIVMEHYRIGSTIAILSRSFCDVDKIKMEDIEDVFKVNMSQLRKYEKDVENFTEEIFLRNKERVKSVVNNIIGRERWE